MTSFSTDKLLKRCYVGTSRLLRAAMGNQMRTAATWRSGASKYRVWLPSLLAIYDIDEMSRLDLAWWQFDALAEVDRFLRSTPGATVFEYGSGASTIWLAQRATAITSVEHDENWYSLLKSRLAAYPNAKLKLVPPASQRSRDDPYSSSKPGMHALSFRDYVHAIEDEPGRFDLIVIDGRCRLQCLQIALAKLKPHGVIVFDNSGRRRYRSGIKASGLEITRHWGLTPCLPYPDETTLMRHAR